MVHEMALHAPAKATLAIKILDFLFFHLLIVIGYGNMNSCIFWTTFTNISYFCIFEDLSACSGGRAEYSNFYKKAF